MQKYYHDIPAWFDGTDDLSDGEYRAYHVIICLIYLRDGPIAANERIAGKCKQHLNAYRANLRKLIEKGKLQIVDGKIVNPRASAEIAKFKRHPGDNPGTTHIHATETRRTPNGHPAHKLLKTKGADSPPTGVPLLSFSLSSTEDSLIQGVEEKKGISKASFDFDEFWRQYPHPVGKRAARTAMEHARKRGAVFTEIIAGLLRYAAKTDDRPWCNPATFLNQERWLDEPARDGGKNDRDETVTERGARLANEARRLEAEIAARRAGRAF